MLATDRNGNSNDIDIFPISFSSLDYILSSDSTINFTPAINTKKYNDRCDHAASAWGDAHTNSYHVLYIGR